MSFREVSHLVLGTDSEGSGEENTTPETAYISREGQTLCQPLHHSNGKCFKKSHKQQNLPLSNHAILSR